MSSVGWATLQIIPSLRGIDRSITTQLNGQAGAAGGEAGESFGREFSKRANDHLSGVGDKFAALAKGAGLFTAAAVGAGSALGVLGVKSAASLEQTQTSFAALLGSTKAASAQIAVLQKYAAATPFSQQDVLGYAQQYYTLAGSVGLSKAQLIPFLNAVGNLGAVTGASTENIHNAVMAIGQIGSAGKVTLDNLNQISEAFPGFNGAAAIANATGQTTAQVMKEISAGTLDAQTGVNALLVGMQKFPGAAGAMIKQSETLNGLFSTFTDTIKIQLTQAFTPLIPVVKTELSTLTPLIATTLKSLAPAIAAFAKGLAPVLNPLVSGIGNILAATFRALAPALHALAPIIAPLAATFVRLISAISPLVTVAARLIGSLGPPLLALFSGLVQSLAPVITAISSALVPVLPILTQAFQSVGAALKPVAAVLATSLITAVRTLAPSIPQLAQAFTGLAVAVGQMLVQLAPLIPVVIQFGTAFLNNVTINLAIALAKEFTTLVTVLTPLVTLLANIASKVGPVFVKALGLIGTAIHTAVAVFKPLVDAINNAISAYEDFKDTVVGGKDVITDVYGEITGNTELIGKFVPAAFGAANRAAVLTPQLNASQFAAGLKALGAALAHNPLAAIAGLGSALAQAGNQAAANIGFTVPTGGFSTPTPSAGGGSKGSKTAPPAFDSTLFGQYLQAAGSIPQTNPITDVLNQIFASAKAAKKPIGAAIAKQLRLENSTLTGEVAQRDKIATQLQDAQQKLQAAIQQRSDAAASFASSIGAFDVTTAGVNQQQYKDQAAAPVTAASILAQLRQVAAKAKQFGAILKDLARKGLPGALLEQLAQAGPAAMDQAQALEAATPQQLKDISSAYKGLVSDSTSVGKALAGDLYDAGVKSAQGLVAGLKSQQSALEAAIKKLGDAMVAALKKTLKIKSPSVVMREAGQFTGEGFRLGIEDKHKPVAATAARLARAAIVKSRADFVGRNPVLTGSPQAGEVHYHSHGIQDPVAFLQKARMLEKMFGP